MYPGVLLHFVTYNQSQAMARDGHLSNIHDWNDLEKVTPKRNDPKDANDVGTIWLCDDAPAFIFNVTTDGENEVIIHSDSCHLTQEKGR